MKFFAKFLPTKRSILTKTFANLAASLEMVVVVLTGHCFVCLSLIMTAANGGLFLTMITTIMVMMMMMVTIMLILTAAVDARKHSPAWPWNIGNQKLF